MDFKVFLWRFAKIAACLLACPHVSPCLAEMPPIGYVGPVAHAEPRLMPPIGYTGPVARPETKATYPQPTPPRFIQPPRTPASDRSDQTLITAKQMRSDDAAGIVTASGNVEVVRNDHLLHADTVSYDKNTGVIAASGHVAVLTPSDNVEFASHQEISSDMKQGFARDVGILFPDNSRMAAKLAQRYDERYMVANNVRYTACNVCRKDPDNPPLWQVSAASVTHDNVKHKLYYHDATIEFAGLPVVYTPYMSAPDPTVKRKQGFLSLTPGVSPNIGSYIRVPYYFDIAPEMDATVSPTFSTKDTVQLEAQFRRRSANSNLTMAGSITYATLIDTNSGFDRGRQWRGDLRGTFLTDIDDNWRAGTIVQYASDRSYLPRYNISLADQTTSRAYIEGFKGRNYYALNSYYFQNLRAGAAITEPFVLPSATISMLGAPGQTLGGRWSFEGNTLITERSNNAITGLPGLDTRRLSLNGGWERQYISDTGLVSTLSGLLRTDSYWANNVTTANGAHSYSRALFTREFVQGNLLMRYPIGRNGDGYQHLVEPIVAFTAAPNVRTISKQPLEDSLDIEFDETNLFSPNRFTGSDLIEGGSRITYGLRNALTTDSGARLGIFNGRSYNFTANRNFSEVSGLDGHASDYVGRIDFSPASWLEANYGYRMAKEDFSPERQDAFISVGAPVFRPSFRYIKAYQLNTQTNAMEPVRQITFGLSSAFAKYWSFSGSHVQSFDPQPGPRTTTAAVTYVDECFAFGISVAHDNTNRVDISSGTSIGFHFYLKNLGGLHTDSTSNIAFPATFRDTGN